MPQFFRSYIAICAKEPAKLAVGQPFMAAEIGDELRQSAFEPGSLLLEVGSYSVDRSTTGCRRSV